MSMVFDGKQYREAILADLSVQISKMDRKPGLAVFCVGENPVCSKYVALKKKMADKIGVKFCDFAYGAENSQEEIIQKIEELNRDENIDGIMVQMPMPEKFDKFAIVGAIAPEKDVDGLRFCCNYNSNFKPPVVLAIIAALESALSCHSRGGGNLLLVDPRAKSEDDKLLIENMQNTKVVVVGKGFLVGEPLIRSLKESIPHLLVADHGSDLEKVLQDTDIVISAVGKAGIVKPEMTREGVILIDAGTAEVSGELRGDIDPLCYQKASFYTPVPGGIGPMTVAMLFQNVVKSSYDTQNKR